MRDQQDNFSGSEKRNVFRARHKNSSHSGSGYVSEFTNFIDAFLGQHPEVVQEQRRGWKIFWDKKVDLAELEALKEDIVPMKPYPHD